MALFYHFLIGGSSELPMWLTDGILVSFFGRWRGAVCIHMSHVQLPYTVINVQDGVGGVGVSGSRTLENSESSENLKLILRW